MSSLREHLSTTEGHAALTFRPDCPLCRAERQLGRHPGGDALVPPRVRASLAACVLAAATLGPAGAAFAQGPPEDEGAADVGEGEIPPELQAEIEKIADELEADGPEPGEDVGGGVEVEEEPLPPELEGAPEEEIPEEERAAEQEAPAASPVPGTPAPGTPVQPGGESPSAAPQGGGEVQGEEQKSSDEKDSPRAERKRGEARSDDGGDAGGGQNGTPGGQAPAPRAPAPGTQGGTAGDDGTGSGSSDAGGRYHVVQSGESLWTIARDLLGPDASAAEVAAMVDKLWSLNAERIGTGSPSLIHAGDRLLLP
jgi:LysM domain